MNSDTYLCNRIIAFCQRTFSCQKWSCDKFNSSTILSLQAFSSSVTTGWIFPSIPESAISAISTSTFSPNTWLISSNVRPFVWSSSQLACHYGTKKKAHIPRGKRSRLLGRRNSYRQWTRCRISIRCDPEQSAQSGRKSGWWHLQRREQQPSH